MAQVCEYEEEAIVGATWSLPVLGMRLDGSTAEME